MTTHVEDADKYISRVLSGEIPACDHVIKACQRQVNDLALQETETFPYYFDDEKAGRVCDFIELLPHVKGVWAGQRARLEGWQKFILTTVFGWMDKENGMRRFRVVYIEVPRKNGKSFITSGVALYMLCADGEEGAECFSAATTRDQAKIVFRTALQMCRKSPGLVKKFGILVGEHNLSIQKTASNFVALSAEGSTLDGLNVHFASNDELHAHKTRLVYDVLESATGSRAQSLIWNITTAGANMAGVCFELRGYVIKILDEVFQDETTFGIIYTIDPPKKGVDGEPDFPGDDWREPETWKKANPNYDVSVFPNDLENACRRAQEISSSQNVFLTKRLDCWVNADTSWMNILKWNACADRSMSLDSFTGRDCFLGVDLASKIDIAALVLLFPENEGYALFAKFYLPEEAVNSERLSKTAHYAGWAKDGHIELTEGNMIDQDYIKADILNYLGNFNVRQIAFDPWQAAKLSTELMKEGADMVEIKPTVQNFSDPMKMFEALVFAGRIRHKGCPVMTWMVSNVVAHYDKKDNIYPNKGIPDLKIDGVVAALMAMNRGNHFIEKEKSIYNDRGIYTI